MSNKKIDISKEDAKVLLEKYGSVRNTIAHFEK